MPQIESCSKCKSSKVIPRARIVDKAESYIPTDLTVHVYENPDAMIFKGTTSGTLHAWICGECGYVETYIDNPGELYSAYLRAKSRQE
jgi:rubrerythrin